MVIKRPAPKHAEKLTNCWCSSHDMARFLQAACRCASLVYDYPTQPSSWGGLKMEPIMHRTPSVTGTVKAASMWKTSHYNKQTTLFVSVRGTASTADHVVNLNGEPKDVGSLFVCGPSTVWLSLTAGY